MGDRNTDIEIYLSTYDYYKYPNRDCICNVLNTVDFDKFQNLSKIL